MTNEHIKQADEFIERRTKEMPAELKAVSDYNPPGMDKARELKESAIDEAKRIVSGPRREVYGHPLDNHTRTAKYWSHYLGIEITAEDVCMLNILQKISRNQNKHDRENIVDIIGYAANIDIIELKREEEK